MFDFIASYYFRSLDNCTLPHWVGDKLVLTVPSNMQGDATVGGNLGQMLGIYRDTCVEDVPHDPERELERIQSRPRL